MSGRVRTWHSERDHTTSWHARAKLGRLEVGYHVHRHCYPTTSDRWVFQPFFIYDRKATA